MAGANRLGGGAYDLNVIGLKELSRALRNCSKEAKKAVRAEAKAAGNIVRDEIRGRAPVGPGAHGGTLKRSVKTQVRRLNVAVLSDARRVSRGWPRGYRYGKRLEFDPKIARPWFYPGYEAAKAAAVERFNKVLEAVERAFKEG